MLTRSPLKLALFATASAAMLVTAGCAGRGNQAKDTAFIARDVAEHDVLDFLTGGLRQR